MANFNKVILAGNLTRDPELRYTPTGTAVARLGLAINRNWKTETGESREETTFVDIDAFGRQAETIAQYLKKGSPLLVEGRLKLDQWDDKSTGQKRSRLGIVLEGFQFLGAPRGGDSAPMDRPARAAAAAPAAAVAASQPDTEPPLNDPEDDVPF